MTAWRNRIVPGIAALTGLGFLTAGVIGWRQTVQFRRDRYDQQRITRLITEGRADEAAALAGARAAKGGDAARRAQWQDKAVNALAEAGDTAQLVTLYRNTPEAVRKNEQASVLTARALRFICRDEKAAQRLIADWHGKERHPDWWFCLRVDTLLRTGDRAHALQLLETQRLPGAADAARLLRRAMFCDTTTPSGLRTAWGYIQQAYRVAPTDPDVRSTRAQVLERLGRFPEARVEYVAAWAASPRSSYHCDQLAEFYRRQGSIALALQTWAQGLHTCPADFLAVKALFWSRMVMPLDSALPEARDRKSLTDSTVALPEGALTPLATYMRQTGTTAGAPFWDDRAFEALPNSVPLARSRQEVYYLRLCDALLGGKNENARQILGRIARQPEMAAANPALIRALQQVMGYRATGKLAAASVTVDPNTERHPLLLELDAAATGRKPLSAETARFLRSEEAIPALFLVTGWWEAALRVRPAGETAPVAADMPGWYTYALTQVLRTNRDDDAALRFAERSASPLPAEQALVGELQLAVGRSAEGEAQLARCARADSDAGMRAAWLLTTHYLEGDDRDAAMRCLQSSPRLAGNVIGQEIMARITLERGDVPGAERRYRAIADRSVEAKTFLARLACSRGEWRAARAHTAALLAKIPDSLTLRADLREIDAHLVASTGGKQR